MTLPLEWPPSKSMHSPLLALTSWTIIEGPSALTACHFWLLLPLVVANCNGVSNAMLPFGTSIALPCVTDVTTNGGASPDFPTRPSAYTQAWERPSDRPVMFVPSPRPGLPP